MAYSGFGLFIPYDGESADIGVLSGVVAGHVTPTEPDNSRVVMSPVARQRVDLQRASKVESSIAPEIVAGYNLDPDNYPADRPQISDEIETAIRGGAMTLSLRGDSRLYNNDIGNAILQVNKTSGIYQDHRAKGTFVFHKNDPILDGSNGDNYYYGKSRVPVIDYCDSSVYYDVDGQTRLSTVRNASIYSDGDFIYSVGCVGSLAGVDVCFFVFEPYRRVFIKRSKINSGSNEFIIGEANTTRFNTVSNYIPMSPVVVRVKHFMNKIVCVFMGVNVNACTSPYLYMFQSYDDGMSWEPITTIDRNAFTNYLPSIIGDFRVRIATDGLNVCVAWGVIENVAAGSGQIRLMYSKDGCSSWEYSATNVGKKMSGNNEDYYDIANPASNTKPENIAFGLSCDGEGRFIIAKAGDGTIQDPTLGSKTGEISLVIGIIDKTDISDYLIVKPNTDLYSTKIDPYSTNIDMLIKEVSLFSDRTHGNEYAIVNVRYTNAYAGYAASQFINCIVRYKIMKAQEWTTCPGWETLNTSPSRVFGDNILLIEPPNRNNVFFQTFSGTSHVFRDCSGIEHRGHIFVIGSDTQNSNFHSLVCMKSWTNVPINYATRLAFHPSLGSPTSSVYGFTASTVGAGASVVVTNAQSTNDLSLQVPSGTNWLGVGNQRSYQSIQVPASLAEFMSIPVGAHEHVIRVCVSKSGGVANTNIRIVDTVSPFYNSGWRLGVMRLYLVGPNNFAVADDYSGTLYTLTDPATGIAAIFDDNKYYEFMFIRSGVSWSIFYRVYNDETNTCVSQEWHLGYARTTGSDGGAFTVGVSTCLLSFGIDSIEPIGGYPWVVPNNIFINIRNLITSKSNTDIYPNASNYLTGNTYVNYLTNHVASSSGVLSSELPWYFDTPSPDNMRAGMRGEFITPNPVWTGTEWLKTVTSNFSKRDCKLWLNFKTVSTITKQSLAIVRNEGNLADYSSDFLLGDGSVFGTMPTLQSPMGMYFDGVNDYMTERFVNDGLNLIDNFTISFWMKLSAAASGYIVSRGNGNAGYRLRYNTAASRFEFELLGSSSNSPAVFADLNKWTHVVAVVYNGYIRWYKDGSEVGVSILPGSITTHANQKMFVGASSAAAGFFTGYLSKVAIFNRALEYREVVTLNDEHFYGPSVPSDFFVRFFGTNGITQQTWSVEATDAGGGASNVTNDLMGSCYYSSRDGLGGAEDGGVAGYNYGDTELILYDKNNSFILANAALIMNCNATDVILYYQNADPRTIAIWNYLTYGRFAYHDKYYGIPTYLVNSAIAAMANGVISKAIADQDWRPGAYAGKRIHVVYSPATDSWYNCTDPDSAYIYKCINNTEDKMHLNELATPTFSGGTTRVYQLGENVLILFGSEISARYWRFVFGNNARNGEKIKVGMVRLGNFTEFQTNPDKEFSITRNIIENNTSMVSGIDGAKAYGDRVLNTFELSMSYSDNRKSNSTDHMRMLQAYSDAIRTGDGVFLALSDKDDKFDCTDGDRSFPLVFRCAPDGDFVMQNVVHGVKSTTLKLKEI